MLNEFAPYSKINGCFIVNNITSPNKTLFIFNYPIPYGASRDLLQIPGISESDIRASLLKGELQRKLLRNEITVVCSDIDLIQFNNAHREFLESSGVSIGTRVASFQYEKLEDVALVGTIDGINRVFTIPSGKFVYQGNYKILVYKNGIRQAFLDDFIIAESGGPGTGYDTVIMTLAPEASPPPADIISADYYVNAG